MPTAARPAGGVAFATNGSPPASLGPMEFAGLPLHFLVVHTAVVFTPLAALAAGAFAVLPKWRWLSRWPTAVIVVIAFGSVWTARLSGASFLDTRPELRQLVVTHEARGELLSYLMIGFLIVTLVAAWALGGTSALASGKGARESVMATAPEKVLSAVLVLTALAALVQVVLTGDAGTRAVWG